MNMKYFKVIRSLNGYDSLNHSNEIFEQLRAEYIIERCEK